jgi:hypothetical protein
MARSSISLAVIAVVFLSSSAFGGLITSSGGGLISIKAETAVSSGQTYWALDEGVQVGDTITWSLGDGVDLYGENGELVASIDSMSLVLNEDPGVSLTFAVTAGPTDTSWTISSAAVAFSPITNPLAFASAAITITDVDSNGASVTGLYAGGKTYKAMYNAGPTTWTTLLPSFSAPVDDSAVSHQRRPFGSGREVILATVSSVQSEFSFKLSANDLAAGTSRFDVIPEPVTVCLLGLGGLALAGARRRRS